MDHLQDTYPGARTIRWTLAGATAVAVLVGVFALSARYSSAQLAQTGGVRLEQAADRLLAQIEGFRKVTHLMARHPVIVEAVAQGTTQDATLAEWLRFAALSNGADALQVISMDGTVLAASDPTRPGPDLASPLLAAVQTGRLGFHHIVDANGQRKFLMARGLLDVQAAVVLTIDVAQLEFEWRIDEDAVVFFDAQDVAFVANRPGLTLRHLNAEGEGGAKPALSERSFYAHRPLRFFGAEVWRFRDPSVLPEFALVRSRAIPQIQMTARAFMDTQSIQRSASLQTALAAALLGVLGLGLWLAGQRRRLLAEANAQLEARVEDRTQALRQAQAELVQASKLSALGRMSAGISHELSQPLATIGNYADTGQKLIARNQPDRAAQNLSEIASQVSRMDRIIRHLRGFARGEAEPPTSVPLAQVVDDALEVSRLRLDEADVTTHIDIADVEVRAGRVRLGQVIVNLISNAADAVEGQARRNVSIIAEDLGEDVILTVSDTGSGLEEPARVFDPFYTTKEIGAAKGLGLGLSISHGIIATFGGSMTAENGPDGAIFRLALKKAEP